MHKVLRLLAMVGLIFLTSILGAILLALGNGRGSGEAASLP